MGCGTRDSDVLWILIDEPVNLREWEPRVAAPVDARLYTAGRPGRGTPGYGRVRRPIDNAIVDTWVAGLPAAEVAYRLAIGEENRWLV
jgi:hypothetical protein